MQNLSIARRYARAMIDVATESASTDRVAEQLDGLASVLRENADLRDVLSNPAYSRAQRGAVVAGLVKVSGKLDPLVQNMLELLLDRHRVGFLPDIARIFRDMADLKAGRVRGKVTSAAPLTPDALKHIETALEQIVQRDVVLETRVDPALLGGVSAQVGSMVYDGSLRTQLESLRQQLRSQ